MKDEYSETELANGLIQSLEQFLLELGNDFGRLETQFTHADAGQMHLYLNYAREHWTHAHEHPPVGLILCSEKDAAVAHYALGNFGNQVLAREYQLNLPNEAEIAARIDAARRLLSAAPPRFELPDE